LLLPEKKAEAHRRNFQKSGDQIRDGCFSSESGLAIQSYVLSRSNKKILADKVTGDKSRQNTSLHEQKERVSS